MTTEQKITYLSYKDINKSIKEGTGKIVFPYFDTTSKRTLVEKYKSIAVDELRYNNIKLDEETNKIKQRANDKSKLKQMPTFEATAYYKSDKKKPYKLQVAFGTVETSVDGKKIIKDPLTDSRTWQVRYTQLDEKGESTKKMTMGYVQNPERIKDSADITIGIDNKDEEIISFGKLINMATKDLREQPEVANVIKLPTGKSTSQKNTGKIIDLHTNFMTTYNEKTSIKAKIDFSRFPKGMIGKEGQQKSKIFLNGPMQYPLLFKNDDEIVSFNEFIEDYKNRKTNKDYKSPYLDCDMTKYLKWFDRFKILKMNMSEFRMYEYKTSTFNEFAPTIAEMVVEIVDRKKSINSDLDFDNIELDKMDKLMTDIKDNKSFKNDFSEKHNDNSSPISGDEVSDLNLSFETN